MAIADALVTRNPNDLDASGWLPVDEVLRRVAERFPLAVVDRERGDRTVREAVDKLVETYLAIRQGEERFLDTFRRAGMAPFKEAVYADAH